MGLGMAAVNAGVLIFPGGAHGNLFLDPMVTDTDQLMNILQIDFLQPRLYLHFQQRPDRLPDLHGYRTMLDINFLLAKPLQSMFLAVAELGPSPCCRSPIRWAPESQRQRLDRYGGRRGRTDGALHLAQPLEGDLRADHRRGLSLLGG